ncbi:MAG: glycosyltransferase family 9 protein [Halobacteriovoraceae bacterium]|nr:glycosyltransferase family 9 protein [Halobacteriovoraceae bacterium]
MNEVFIINRTDAIGDTVLTMPVCKAIKDKYPQAKIYFLTSKKCIDLFDNHLYIDGHFFYGRGRNFFTKFYYVRKIYKEIKPTHYIYFGGSHFPSFMAWFCGIKFRGGLVSRFLSFLFLNRGIRQQRSMVEMHEAEYNMNCLRPLGIEYTWEMRNTLDCGIFLTEEELSACQSDFRKTLDENGLDGSREYVFIHPGMVGHTLNWSSRNYGRLIIRLSKFYGDRFNYIISYTPWDNKYLLGLKEVLKEENFNKNEVFFFNGLTKGLRHYMSILKNAAAFIGPSTGTTHLANVLGVNTVAIYSPIKVQSALRWGPLHNNDRLEKTIPDVVCGETKKCAGESCPYFDCMNKIEVADIFDNVYELIDRNH